MSNITKAIAALGVVAGLGVAALPLSSYAAESGPVKVYATVDSTISVTTDANEVNMGTITPAGPVSSGIAKVTVTTSSTDYDLSVMTATSRTALAQVNENGVVDTTNSIPTGAAAKGQTFWGVRSDSTKAYQAVGAYGSATPLDKTALNAGSAVTDVEFGVSIGSGFTGTGTFENDVIFVATAKS